MPLLVWVWSNWFFSLPPDANRSVWVPEPMLPAQFWKPWENSRLGRAILVMCLACEIRSPIRKKDRILVGTNARAMLSLQAHSSIATAKRTNTCIWSTTLSFSPLSFFYISLSISGSISFVLLGCTYLQHSIAITVR